MNIIATYHPHYSTWTLEGSLPNGFQPAGETQITRLEEADYDGKSAPYRVFQMSVDDFVARIAAGGGEIADVFTREHFIGVVPSGRN